MIEEKAFLKLCETNGIMAFKVTTELDETDIILDTEDINVFIELCNCYGAKCVFYYYVLQQKDDYELDEDKLKHHIEDIINSDKIRYEYNFFGTNDDVIDVDYLLEKYLNRIDSIIEKQNELLEKKVWGTPLILEAFIPYNGDRIGIQILNDEVENEADLTWDGKLMKKIDKELEEDIIAMYEENSRNNAELRAKEHEETKKRYEAAILEIKEILKESNRLLTCTNGKLRHAYARDLANEYSEKYDCYITIGEVDVFVEEEYRRQKSGR